MRKLYSGISLFTLLLATAAFAHAQQATTDTATPAATTQQPATDTTAQQPAATPAADTATPPPPPAPKYPPSQQFISQEGRFSVVFAGTPKKESNPVPLEGGESTTMNQFSVALDDNNDSYMLLYNDYPADYANGDPRTILESLRDGSVKGKTLISDNAISLSGVPGRAFTSIDGNGWIFTVHQYLKGKRLYQLIVVGTAYHPAYLSDQFMSSFKIW